MPLVHVRFVSLTLAHCKMHCSQCLNVGYVSSTPASGKMYYSMYRFVNLILAYCKVYYSQCRVCEFDSFPIERYITLNVGCVNSTPAHGEVYYLLQHCVKKVCQRLSYWRSVIFSLNKFVNTI